MIVGFVDHILQGRGHQKVLRNVLAYLFNMHTILTALFLMHFAIIYPTLFFGY